jgi:hypothetical protein
MSRGIDTREPCAICGTADSLRRKTTSSERWNCVRCGQYFLTYEAAEALVELIKRAAVDPSMMSHRVRLAHNNSQAEVIIESGDLFPYTEMGPPPNPEEQLELLLLWIGDNQKQPSEKQIAPYSMVAAVIGCAIDVPAEENFAWLLAGAADRGLYTAIPAQTVASDGIVRPWQFSLTMAGWSKYYELAKRVSSGMNIFMAMQFNDPELEHVLKACFRPAAERAGFLLRKLTDGQGAGLIDNQIRARIRAARMVIADLTHDNNGAYFEAGFAEGLELDVIYTCRADKFKEKKTHFDTNHMVTIQWDVNDLAAAQRSLTASIRNTLPDIAKMADDGDTP